MQYYKFVVAGFKAPSTVLPLLFIGYVCILSNWVLHTRTHHAQTKAQASCLLVSQITLYLCLPNNYRAVHTRMVNQNLCLCRHDVLVLWCCLLLALPWHVADCPQVIMSIGPHIGETGNWFKIPCWYTRTYYHLADRSERLSGDLMMGSMSLHMFGKMKPWW
jgi:hypothetical protein